MLFDGAILAPAKRLQRNELFFQPQSKTADSARAAPAHAVSASLQGRVQLLAQAAGEIGHHAQFIGDGRGCLATG